MNTALRKALLQLLMVGGAYGLPQQTGSSPSLCSPANNCLGVKALEPRFFKEAQSQRLEITHGKFTVPGTSDNHGMKTFVFDMTPPCTDCFITYIQADLRYLNGSYANVNTGMWLHHVAIVNYDRERRVGVSAAVCPGMAEMIFASGNERMPANICVNGTQKAGYYIAPDTTLLYFTAELMNDREESRDAAVVLDWEFVPKTPGFKQASVLWLDIDGACTTRGSEVPVPDNGAAKVFSLSMTPPWKATFSADILFILSHLHDGGETLQTTKNGATVCDSAAKYGESEGYVSTTIHEHGGAKEKRHTVKTPHVSSMNSCFLPKDKILPGDEWTVRANYNMTNHKGNLHGGELAPVMGISMVYVVKN